jgi:hypothetical protein
MDSGTGARLVGRASTCRADDKVARMTRVCQRIGAPLIALLLAAPASAQPIEAGQALPLISSFRGPFQHAVVGSSLVQAYGSILGTAGADVALPAGSVLRESRVFWMGSRPTPDSGRSPPAASSTSSFAIAPSPTA